MTDKNNIGKRVIYRLIKPQEGMTGLKKDLNGMPGTIIGIYDHICYRVNFDHYFPGHNSCNGLIPQGMGYGYTVDYRLLEIIDDVEKNIKIKWYKNGEFID